MTWRKNTGKYPRSAKGKRVHVRLVNGYADPLNGPRWPADEKGGCNWDQTGSDWDIAEYEVINE